jgi:hypothetical protein
MFDRYVSGTRPSWQRRAVLIASVATHGVVAVGLLVAGLFHVAEISPPALAVVFIATPEPPPSAPSQLKKPRTQSGKRPATPTPTPTMRATVAPATSRQPTPPAKTDVPEGPDDEGEQPGGQKGPGGGPPDSQGTDPNGGFGHGPAMPPPRPRNIAPHLLDAQKIAGADPHLPDFVKNARRGLGDSAFSARICVDQAGSVSRIDVLQGIPGADEAIVQALRGWRYRAQPIPVCFVSRFVFDVQ